jgi:hypothetical protein
MLLSPLLFNVALEYVIKKVQEIKMGLKLNGTHQLLAYAAGVNLLGDNITRWPLVCKRTIPTERPPLVGEI